MSSAISTDIYTVATHTRPKGRAMWMDVLNTQLTVRSHIRHDRTPLAAVSFGLSSFWTVPFESCQPCSKWITARRLRWRSHIQLYSLMQEVSDAVSPLCLQLWEGRTKACCSHRGFFKTKPGFSLRDHLLRSPWSNEQWELAYSPSVLRSDKAAKAVLNDNGPHLSNEHGNRHRFRCGTRLTSPRRDSWNTAGSSKQSSFQ